MKIEYRVLSGASAKSLEDQVNDLYREGYKLVGGVSTAYVGSPLNIGEGHEQAAPESILFSQAMAKKVEE